MHETFEADYDVDPRLRSVDSDHLIERLSSGSFSLAEGLAFYNRCIETGASFPIEWEARILELGITEHPERDDMRERLAVVRSVIRSSQEAVSFARSIKNVLDLSDSEQIQVRQLLDGTLSTSQGHSLFSDLRGRGVVIPADWEEALLRQCLLEEPSRVDLIKRLRHLVVASGRSLTPVMEEQFRVSAKEDEYGTDHQAAAQMYDQKTSFSDLEPAFLDLIEPIKPFTMTSVERMYALYKSVRFIVEANIPGDIVECGVWRGGSMMLVAKTLLALGVTNRQLYLFDTYEGLPRPDEARDVDVWGHRAIDGWLPMQVDNDRSLWCNAGMEEVRENLASTGYPREGVHLIKGLVETTIPRQAPDSIAILRLDTDWYASTKHELEHLYPRISRNGVLIIDDYGHFRGARSAVDEYFSENKLPLLLTRVDYSGRIATKT